MCLESKVRKMEEIRYTEIDGKRYDVRKCYECPFRDMGDGGYAAHCTYPTLERDSENTLWIKDDGIAIQEGCPLATRAECIADKVKWLEGLDGETAERVVKYLRSREALDVINKRCTTEAAGMLHPLNNPFRGKAGYEFIEDNYSACVNIALRAMVEAYCIFCNVLEEVKNMEECKKRAGEEVKE